MSLSTSFQPYPLYNNTPSLSLNWDPELVRESPASKLSERRWQLSHSSAGSICFQIESVYNWRESPDELEV